MAFEILNDTAWDLYIAGRLKSKAEWIFFQLTILSAFSLLVRQGLTTPIASPLLALPLRLQACSL